MIGLRLAAIEAADTLELVDASSCSRSNHIPFSRTFSRW